MKIKREDFSGDKILKMPKIGKSHSELTADYARKKQVETERRIKARFSR